MVFKDYFNHTQKLKATYKDEKCIVLMQVGDFYEVYGLKNSKTCEIFGSEIIHFSKTLDMEVKEKSNVTFEDNKVLMSGFPIYKRDHHVLRLYNAGLIVAIYDQKVMATGEIKRVLSETISKGTFLYSESEKLSNNCSCVWMDKTVNLKTGIKNLYIGMSTIDVYTGKSHLFQYDIQYISNSSEPYDELERFIISFLPSQIIFIYNLENQEINNIINYLSINNAIIHKYNVNDPIDNNLRLNQINNCQKQTYQKKILEKFFKIDILENYYRYSYATDSFIFLLEFVQEHNPAIVNKITSPLFQNNGNRTLLANHSLKQLNITSNADLIDSNKSISSLAKFLNKAITAMGKRLLHHSILNPIINTKELQDKYNKVYNIIHFDYSIEKMRKMLSKISDIDKLNRKMIKKDATPNDIYNFYTSILVSKESYNNYLNFINSTNYGRSILNSINLQQINSKCDDLLSLIDSYIDKDKCVLITSLDYETNFIKKGVNDKHDALLLEYYELDGKLNSITQYLNIELEKVANRVKDKVMIELEYKKDETNIIVTSARCKKLIEYINKSGIKNKYKDLSFYNEYENKKYTFPFLIDISCVPAKKGSSYIKSNEITSICNRIDELKKKIYESTKKIYLEFLQKINEKHILTEDISMFISEMDLNYTKAFIANKYNYCMPVINDSCECSFANIKQLRHPIIENIPTTHTYIPNDVSIGGNQQGILLYGTNAVGKSSLIKAIGISVIMAQAGFFVPASDFEFKPYHSIFTRILGNDNLFKGLSTFAVEVLELKTILSCANKNSLVIGDEVCSGTEVESATSIIVASLKHLYKQNTSFIFATHYHEICDYNEIKEMKKLSIKHLSVSLNKETGKLEYNRILLNGQGDTFYGLTVAEAYKLPVSIINDAYEIRNKYLHNKGMEETNILNLKSSRYNSNKLVGGICEKCGKNISRDVHHLQHQKNADKNGFIGGKIHKNNLANLLSICQECHTKFHETDRQHINVKTTKGFELKEL